jgi:hypothetical protein
MDRMTEETTKEDAVERNFAEVAEVDSRQAESLETDGIGGHETETEQTRPTKDPEFQKRKWLC